MRDVVRAARRNIESLNETIQAYGDARDRLTALAPASRPTDDTVALQGLPGRTSLTRPRLRVSTRFSQPWGSSPLRSMSSLSRSDSVSPSRWLIPGRRTPMRHRLARDGPPGGGAGYREHIRRATELAKPARFPSRTAREPSATRGCLSSLTGEEPSRQPGQSASAPMPRRRYGAGAGKTEDRGRGGGKVRLIEARKALRGKYMALREKVQLRRRSPTNWSARPDSRCASASDETLTCSSTNRRSARASWRRRAQPRPHRGVVSDAARRTRANHLRARLHRVRGCRGLGDDRSRRVLDFISVRIRSAGARGHTAGGRYLDETERGSDNRQFYKDASELCARPELCRRSCRCCWRGANPSSSTTNRRQPLHLPHGGREYPPAGGGSRADRSSSRTMRTSPCSQRRN